MRRIVVLIILLAAVVAAAAPAAEPPGPAQSTAAPPTEVLGRMSDADETASIQLDPADAAWIAWLQCDGRNACADAATIAQLKAQNPDNAAIWMPDVAAAQRTGDARQRDAALQRMAQASRYDDHIYAIARQSALHALPAQPAPVDAARAIRAFLAASAMTPRSLDALVRSCRDVPQPDRARREICLRIGSMMENGGSLLGQMAGQTLIMHDSGNPAVRDAALLRQRERAWQMRQTAALSRAMLDDPALAKDWLQAIRTHTSETGMVAALLTARGIPLQPPSDGRQ